MYKDDSVMDMDTPRPVRPPVGHPRASAENGTGARPLPPRLYPLARGRIIWIRRAAPASATMGSGRATNGGRCCCPSIRERANAHGEPALPLAGLDPLAPLTVAAWTLRPYTARR